ncbi:MAG: hypothetical protein P0116_03580 [Candidatus Nitrosocosmicus sp.]|nr:hypothetical protein [Candidatus Nitrosocosmicus sp.]
MDGCLVAHNRWEFVCCWLWFFLCKFLTISIILSIDSLFGFVPIDKLFAVIAVAIFAFVNIRGTSETGKIGTVVTMFSISSHCFYHSCGFVDNGQ